MNKTTTIIETSTLANSNKWLNYAILSQTKSILVTSGNKKTKVTIIKTK